MPLHKGMFDNLITGKTTAAVPAGDLKVIAGLYRFCAISLRFPDLQWFTRDYLDTLYQLLTHMGGLDQKLIMEQAFAGPVLSLEELQIDYTRLFINGVPHVLAPPYASVYLDKSLQGQSAEHIMSYYHSKGFLKREGSELPDHIVSQLEFLAYLVERGDQAGEAHFLTQFFSPWFHSFLSRVVNESRHPFYRIIVQMVDYFTKEEEQHGVQDIEA